MILLKNNYRRLFASVLTLAIISCSNPWDDRENNGDANLSVNLTEAITNTSDVSQFAALLKETGYDKVLAASKTYTVFVPTDAAMAEVDEAILNDEEALKQFVANHIALTAYSSVRSEDVRVKMLSNKYLDFEGSTTIDGSTIVTADHYAANGVFHIINKALTPKLNIWEYVKSQEGNSAMADYLLSLKEFSIYASDADAKALSESRGAGYQSDSLTNSYLKNVYNLNNEKNNYTLFLMKDAGYTTEVDKMKPYTIKITNDVTIDSTAIYARYYTVKDLAFAKKYKKADLPASLVSRFGVEVPIDQTKIVDEIHLSNGIVYIMDQVDVPVEKRLLTRIIEGEKNRSYFNFGRGALSYRNRIDPFGVLFDDIMVQNPGAALPIISYSASEWYSTTYKVYWRAVNDIQTNTFQQFLSINGNSQVVNNVTTATEKYKDFSYTTVPVKNYGEVYLGEFTLDKARDLNFILLVGANTATNGNNSLTLDYLKFVPVLK
ncbi:fasciclin domain-containing protein [Flavobacterium flavipallidum]|uniref:Fasciclin domain-containing protein n=1 Tax=Flavobacterium flavipallidum TaxID=3139140 RepID=A0ABU9HLC4_9FLAO